MTTALTVPVEGGQLAAEIAGDGPGVVLVHGFTLDMRSWDAVFADLSQDHRVLRYDLRGFGRSSLPNAPYDHLADLQQVIARGFGPDRAVTVVGLSLGANIALRAALEAEAPGERPAAVVLCSPGLPGHVWTSGERPPDVARALGQREGQEAAQAYWTEHALFAPLRAAGLGPDLDRILAEYSGFHWRNPDPQRPAPPLAGLFDRLAVPALLLNGALELPGYLEIGAILADRMPGLRRTVMPGAGHMLAMERPAETTALIRAFLTETLTERRSG